MDRRALVDDRIRTLLTSTDLTFKQIIEQLRGENMPASFNTIRRVNRNHRYRKPRYDAKLTPQQRKELIVKLKNTTRPNLSSLARQYGVCHGSIWYWWDKLSKIREKNGGQIPRDEPALDFEDLMDDMISSEVGEVVVRDDNDNSFGRLQAGPNDPDDDDDDNDYFVGDPDSDPLDLDEEEVDCFQANRNTNTYHSNSNKHIKNINGHSLEITPNEIGNNNRNNNNYREDHEQSIRILSSSEIVGPVQAKTMFGEFINLPIIMYAPSITSNSSLSTIIKTNKANNNNSSNNMKSISSGASTSLNSSTLTASSSGGSPQTGSLSKRLGFS